MQKLSTGNIYNQLSNTATSTSSRTRRNSWGEDQVRMCVHMRNKSRQTAQQLPCFTHVEHVLARRDSPTMRWISQIVGSPTDVRKTLVTLGNSSPCAQPTPLRNQNVISVQTYSTSTSSSVCCCPCSFTNSMILLILALMVLDPHWAA